MSEYVHEFSWNIEAKPEAAFTALTSPDALQQWFAEYVEIDPREGGAFKFWGKHTIETPSKAQATQKITSFDPPQHFSFSWRLYGRDSEISFEIKDGEEDGKIKVNGRHAFVDLPDMTRPKHMIADLWMLNHGNLKAYLDGGEGISLPDYDDPSPEINQSVLIDAPRPEVFKALITPEILAKWMWAENAEVEPKNGGKYSYGWSYDVGGEKVAGGPTRILDYVENEKLVTDWPDWRGDKSVPVQTVTWLLADENGKTRVTVIHSGFTRTVDFSDYPFGWAGFLAQLKGVVEAD